VRARHGLRPLAVARGLRTAAAVHSSALATSGLFQHESVDGSSFDRRLSRFYPRAGSAYWTVGENLMYGSAPITARTTVRVWMDSPGHRRNLLSSLWREIGVAAVLATAAPGVYGGDDVVIVTADFGSRSHG
jgi:uncharacterized protein YkwD